MQDIWSDKATSQRIFNLQPLIIVPLRLSDLDGLLLRFFNNRNTFTTYYIELKANI